MLDKQTEKDKKMYDLKLSSFVENTAQIVTFNLGDEEFAINIKCIQEIIKVQPVTPVPLTKPYVEGVMNIRGNIIPVVNMRVKMGFPEAELTPKSRIIVVNFENRRVGFTVDSMNEVIRVSNDSIQPSPGDSFENDGEKFIEAVCTLDSRLITVLNTKKLLEVE